MNGIERTAIYHYILPFDLSLKYVEIAIVSSLGRPPFGFNWFRLNTEGAAIKIKRHEEGSWNLHVRPQSNICMQPCPLEIRPCQSCICSSSECWYLHVSPRFGVIAVLCLALWKISRWVIAVNHFWWSQCYRHREQLIFKSTTVIGADVRPQFPLTNFNKIRSSGSGAYWEMMRGKFSGFDPIEVLNFHDISRVEQKQNKGLLRDPADAITGWCHEPCQFHTRLYTSHASQKNNTIACPHQK